MWWWKKSSHDEGQVRYGVFLHVKDLPLTDSTGRRCTGGAYTWRYVTARDPDTAATMAIESLLTTPAFVNEVENPRKALENVTVERVIVVRRRIRRRGTGVVFYIDTDDEK